MLPNQTGLQKPKEERQGHSFPQQCYSVSKRVTLASGHRETMHNDKCTIHITVSCSVWQGLRC